MNEIRYIFLYFVIAYGLLSLTYFIGLSSKSDVDCSLNLTLACATV